MSEPVVRVEDLVVESGSGGRVLDGVSLSVAPGEALGVVGESGSGKTTLAHALLGFARPGLRIVHGSVRILDDELAGRSEPELRRIRGRRMSYVPQDPATALNPSIRIGRQIAEIRELHAPRGGDVASAVSETLARVGLPTDSEFQRRFPHQLSGGQQQRVAIGMAVACDPPLIVLDEPTTGLDVITQSRILDEVRRLQRDLGISLIYVSHDLAAVASVTDRVMVMYAGVAVETGPTAVVTRRPRHPYARGLVSSIPDHQRPRKLVGIPGVAAGPHDRPHGCRFAPRCPQREDECERAQPAITAVGDQHEVRCRRWPETPAPSSAPREVPIEAAARSLLTVRELCADHPSPAGAVRVVHDVAFDLSAGSCLALVGESGSGKTTTARCIVGLHAPASGKLVFDGDALAATARERTLEQRRRIQVVFQNPYESLNPRHSVGKQIAWPARALGGLGRADAARRAAEALERVRLPATTLRRYPSELSGGERQRVAIARALVAEPDLLVCDEVTSALDVSVQAAVLNLLGELRSSLGLALLFITHDLAVVASVADHVLVMESGRVVERGTAGAVLGTPVEPYTRKLVDAAPSLAVDVSSTA